MIHTEPMARSFDHSLSAAAETSDGWLAVPREHAITRIYLLPAGSAADFMGELIDDTEEPAPALHALLSGARPSHTVG